MAPSSRRRWLIWLAIVAGATGVVGALAALLRGRRAPAFTASTTNEPVPWPEIPTGPLPAANPVATFH